jgi:N,N'-diacetyllegionaminate synthase
MPGPDHQASATVNEFASLIQSIREVQKCLGGSEKKFSDGERDVGKAARKSIVVTRDMKKGEMVSLDDICFKRPGIGLLPTERDMVIGLRLANDVGENRVLRLQDIDWP